jgi:nitroreductase
MISRPLRWQVDVGGVVGSSQQGGKQMADFLEVLKTRRSVRAYTNEAVSEEDLRELIGLAVLAPTGMNSQPWKFSIVTNREVLGKLNAAVIDYLRSPELKAFLPADLRARTIDQPGYSIFYNAPALVVIAARSEGIGMVDCQLAAENLFLAAHAKGLGTCYMGFLTMAARKVRAIGDLCRLAEGDAMMAATIVGHPAAKPDGLPVRSVPPIEWVR